LKNDHWRTVSNDPISPLSQALVSRRLADVYGGVIHDLSKYWNDKIRGRTLLDIGVVEHTMEFAGREGWRHGVFAKLASRAVGVDILAPEVDQLNRQGYDIRLCDATSDVDLGERFEVVYIGDVIEHVNDPVRLIRFAARHLTANGTIIVSTPCPFWWRNIRLMIADHTYIGNVDHVRWVTPANALELGHRAGVSLTGYETVETHGHTALRKLVQSLIGKLLGRTEFFAWAYMYTFAVDDGST